MRKFILSAAIAALAAISFAAPSHAGGYGHHRHHGGDFSIGFYNSGYYGDGYYNDSYYEPTCFIKKVKRWDRWGNLHIKKIKICE